MNTITLTIPKASPSLNTINGRHWIHYRTQKKLWEKLIWVAKAEEGVHGMPRFERANVSITRYGVKPLDRDNLVGGCKMIVDALKTLGLIVDDSEVHIQLDVAQKITKVPRTVILVGQIFAAA